MTPIMRVYFSCIPFSFLASSSLSRERLLSDQIVNEIRLLYRGMGFQRVLSNKYPSSVVVFGVVGGNGSGWRIPSSATHRHEKP